MRRGVQEVLPRSALAALTAEDLRLMLCGCPHIDVEVLRAITVFDDESRKFLLREKEREREIPVEPHITKLWQR